MIPEDDPVLILARKWFKKLDDPNCATYKIAHASIAYEVSPTQRQTDNTSAEAQQ